MNSHKHCRLTPAGRALLVARVLDGRCRTGHKREQTQWVYGGGPFQSRGAVGLIDRDSRRHSNPEACSAVRAQQFAHCRRERIPVWHIVREVGRNRLSWRVMSREWG